MSITSILLLWVMIGRGNLISFGRKESMSFIFRGHLKSAQRKLKLIYMDNSIVAAAF